MSTNYLFGTANQEIGKSALMNDLAKVIGANVRRYRQAAGMSWADLAEAIGVKSANTIAAIEAGGGTKHLAKIARALKVKLADLDPSEEGEETVTIPGGMSGSEQMPQLDVYASVECGNGAIVWSN